MREVVWWVNSELAIAALSAERQLDVILDRMEVMPRYTYDHDTGRKISGWGIDYDRSHNRERRQA